MEGPLAVMLTPETVKSVRFCSRLSQTPVSFFRLLMQVKEWRFEVSSEGNRIRETGQLMKFRDLRVERDWRAVKDKATSSEQLESVRERRWRKGEEASQVVVGAVAERGGGEQGFLEVGMLRDWSALSCFGSRGEEEEVGEEREGGLEVGVEDGDGAEGGDEVGETAVLAAPVELAAERRRRSKKRRE